jgi:hypothetical protein
MKHQPRPTFARLNRRGIVMKRIGFFLLMMSGLISCEVINPDEKLPAYIYIEEIDFTTNYNTQGTDSHKISELWVYANGNIVGIFDLPAMIPILEEGTTELTIAPGIRNNGIAADRIIYPFYKTWKKTVNLKPLTTDTLVPAFEYIDNAAFPMMFDFEDAGISFSTQAGYDMELVQEPETVFEGIGSGYVRLDSNQPIYLGVTAEQLDLNAGQRVFLELDYRCNNTFAVGIKGNGLSFQREIALMINPTQSQNGANVWNKIYVELSYVLGLGINAPHFEFFIESQRDGGVSVGHLWVDNLKIVQYQQ